MKVLLTSDHNPTTVNGVIVSVLLLKRELEKQGCEVKLLVLSPTLRSYKEDDVYYIGSVPLGLYPDLRASMDRYNKLIDELIDWNPDIIHSQCEFFTYSFVQRIARHCHCPIVHTYHTQYEYYTQYVLPGNWDRLLAKIMQVRLESSDVVIAPTGKTRQYLLTERISGDIRVIPTGIDLEAFSKPLPEEEQRAIRDRLGVPADWRLYGSIGRVAREKNLSEVLRAHQMIRKHHPDWGLLIVGDGAGMEEIRTEVRRLGLSGSVFFTGMVPKEHVGTYYQLLDCFVSASTSETQGLTYIEALSNGRPVVARRDGAIEGVVVDGENGYQFDTTEACAAFIEEVLSDAALWEKLSAGAVESSKRFGKEIFGEAVYALYGEVLNRDNRLALKESKVTTRFRTYLKTQADKSDVARIQTRVKAGLRGRAYRQNAEPEHLPWWRRLKRRKK